MLLGHVVERELAKTALRISKEHLRVILDAAPDAIFSVNCPGMITRVKPAAEKIFGYTADEMLARNLDVRSGKQGGTQVTCTVSRSAALDDAGWRMPETYDMKD